MFEQRFSDLYKKKVEKRNDNLFTTSGNGALKLVSTGDPFVDQFSFISQYRNQRSFKEIDKDMRTLWDINPLLTMKLVFYIRLISRNPKDLEGVVYKPHIGQGLKHESIMRLIWVEVNYPQVFYDNLPLLVTSGCWNDIFQMMIYDLTYHGWEGRVLHWKDLSDFILVGLRNPNSSELVKKFLPTIKARSKTHTVESQAQTILGKYLAHRLFGIKGDFSDKEYHPETYKKYRLLKSSGTAHQWQQQISRGNFNIDFNTVPGRALSLLVSGNFLKNHGLEKKYEKWILSQPVAKFTGYVYELFKGLKEDSPNYKKVTINKQFQTLIDKANQDKPETRFWVVRDTSSSMSSKVPGTSISSDDVAKAMGLYFSYLLEEPFNRGYIEFSENARIVSWKGESPVERYLNDKSNAYGDTNFLDVSRIFGNLKASGIPLDKFPNGILCLSDGEFNDGRSNKTNFVEFKDRLIKAGFPSKWVEDFKIVLWDIPNTFYSRETSRPKFESFSDTPNFFYMSGLDPAGISFLLTGKYSPDNRTPKTPRELFEAAMNQELLNMIVI